MRTIGATARALVASAAMAAGGCSQSPSPAGLVIRPLPDIATAASGQAHLSDGEAQPIVLSWLEPESEGHVLKYARFENGGWGPPERLTSSEDWFINWADFPSVVPIDDSLWAAHWLVARGGGFAYDVVTAVSNDAGATWSEPRVLNDDGTDTEHGFATLFPWGDEVGVVWLDGRRLADWTFEKELSAEGPLGTSVYYARLARDGRVLERGEIDELVCDCCATDVAIGASGPLLVYRDRTPEEIRDIVVSRYAGSSWQDAVPAGADNFEIDGCPVNGPVVEARGNEVAAAWFTAPGNSPKIRFSRSHDGGQSFEPAIDLDADGAFGQVDLALLEDSSAVVSWWRRAEQRGGLALVARRVGFDGELGSIHTIAESHVAQPLDVPQMVYTGEGFVFAWTGVDERAGVHTVYVTGL